MSGRYVCGLRDVSQRMGEKRDNRPATEADSSMCRTEGMLFHSEKLSFSSIISFSSVPISLEMKTNWA
jgi:hypothetical protein